MADTKKVKMGPQTWVMPLPALLIGTVVEGKVNFMTAAWGSVANAEPPMLCVAIRRSRHSRKGIELGGSFSVNVASASQARQVDFCGMQSGARVDKVAKCGFGVFYGTSRNAPLIEQCPLNMECTVAQIVELGTHSLIIAAITETHVSEECLTDGKLDVQKVDPIIYLSRKYAHAGVPAGDAFSLGLTL